MTDPVALSPDSMYDAMKRGLDLVDGSLRLAEPLAEVELDDTRSREGRT